MSIGICSGFTDAQVEIWATSSVGARVILSWEWLRHEVVGKDMVGVHKADAPLLALLDNIHGAAKVKMHTGERATSIICDAHILCYSLFVPTSGHSC